MVKSIEILNKLVEKQDFKDGRDVDYLLNICRENPNFTLPFLLLKNFQPDIFNADYWKIGDEFDQNLKELYDCYYGKLKAEELPTPQNNIKGIICDEEKILKQNKLIQEFIKKPKQTFI